MYIMTYEAVINTPGQVVMRLTKTIPVIDLNKSLLVSNLDLKPVITAGSDYVNRNLISALRRLLRLSPRSPV